MEQESQANEAGAIAKGGKGLAFTPYHAKEVEHQMEIARLETEIKERKLKIEEEIEADYRRYKKRLEDAVERLQQQCEEIDLRFRSHRERLERENSNFWPRLDEAMKHEAEMSDREAEEAARAAEAEKAEVEHLQAELDLLSAKAAKLEAAIDALHRDIVHLEELAYQRRQELQDVLRELGRRCSELTRELDVLDVKLRKELSEKDEQLSVALDLLHGDYTAKENSVKELEGHLLERIQVLENLIREAKARGQQLQEELPRRVNNLKKEVLELKGRLENPEENEEAIKKRIRVASQTRIKESEETLNLKHGSLGKLHSDLLKKASDLKALLDSFEGKTGETERAHETRMAELKRKYETLMTQRQEALKRLGDGFVEAIQSLKQSCVERQEATEKMLQDLQDRSDGLRKKYDNCVEALTGEIEKLQAEVDERKRRMASQEDEHFRQVGELKINYEESLILLDRIAAARKRVQTDSERELAFLTDVEGANRELLGKKIGDRVDTEGKLDNELSALQTTVELHKEKSLQAIENANNAISQDNDDSAAEVEKILCAIKTIKGEIEEDRDTFQREMSALDDTMKREKATFLNEKERLYALMNKEQQRNQDATDEVKDHIRRALEEQDQLFRYRSEQTQTVLKGVARKAEEYNEGAGGRIQQLERRVEVLIHTIREVEEKITAAKKAPRRQEKKPSGLPQKERKRDLGNKLYVIEECSGVLKVPRGVDDLREKCESLVESNEKLMGEISALRKRRRSNASETIHPPERLESVLMESKLANLQHENRQLEKTKCRTLSQISHRTASEKAKPQGSANSDSEENTHKTNATFTEFNPYN